MSEQKQKISWEAPEFRNYEKSAGWYIAAIVIALGIIAFFVFFEKDYFAATTILVVTAVVLYFATHTPKIVNHELSNKGVSINNIHFPYQQLKYFWVVQTDHHKTVNFITSTTIGREIILELENQDPEEARQFLLPHLPEHHEPEPTLSQRASHFFKF